MRGDKSRSNSRYEVTELSPLEKAGLEPGDVVRLEDRKEDVVPLTKKKTKKEVFAKGTEPSLKGPVPEDNFADEPTKVFKRKPSLNEEVDSIMEGLDKAAEMAEADKAAKRRTSQDTKDAMADIGVHVKETDDALDLVRETAIQSKKARREDLTAAEAEEIKKDIEIARARSVINTSEESEVKKLDKEIKAGFKSASSESLGRAKSKAASSSKENSSPRIEAKLESERVKNAKAFAENAIRTYSKLYIEYDPKAISKLYEGKKNADELVAALDLTAITPPPFKAIFTSKGRQLRDVYGKVQEAIKKYNEEVEAQ